MGRSPPTTRPGCRRAGWGCTDAPAARSHLNVQGPTPWWQTIGWGRIPFRKGAMKIHWTWSVAWALAVVAGAPRAWADVAPPGLFECSTASAGAACQMQTAGTPVGGTCLVSKCGSKVACTDAAAANPPECADGGMPGFPGYGLVYNDCLLCNPDAGVPPAPPASPDAGEPPAPTVNPDAAAPSAPGKHGSSGCAVAHTGAKGASSAWWLGGTMLPLLGQRRRRWSSLDSALTAPRALLDFLLRHRRRPCPDSSPSCPAASG